jgi:hypothetical protein
MYQPIPHTSDCEGFLARWNDNYDDHNSNGNNNDNYYNCKNSSNGNMPEPTLGCQIAPNYNHEQWPYNSEDSSTDSGSEEQVGSALELAATRDGFDIEMTETQHVPNGVLSSRPTTLQKGRTRSSRKDAPQPPVGFWHWQMVCVVPLNVLQTLTESKGRCSSSCVEIMGPHQ